MSLSSRKKLLTVAALGATAALLAGCGSAPNASDVPPGASFAANILDDGTKLFTFELHMQRPGPGAMRGAGGPPDEEQAEMRRRSARANLGEASKKALQAMMLENRYCHEGYVIHEMYEDRASYVIRGECRDAATDGDRARYPRRAGG